MTTIQIIALISLIFAVLAEGASIGYAASGWKSNKPSPLVLLSIPVSIGFYILAIATLING